MVQSKHIAYLHHSISVLVAEYLDGYLLAGNVFCLAATERTETYAGEPLYSLYHSCAHNIFVAFECADHTSDRITLRIEDATIMHSQLLLCVHHQMIQLLVALYNFHKVSLV